MTVLESIIEGVLADLANRKMSSAQLDELVSVAPEVRSALDSLRKNKFSVIAEVKRSSPSKGELAQIAQPDVLASSYEAAGASVVSVLTEQRRFSGSLADLQSVKQAVAIPVLRKDFIVNEYLVRESRAFGADLLLLIVAALEAVQLRDLYQLSTELGMQTLIEVHDERELEVALNLDPAIIGVNSRNLKTLDIDLSNFSKLLPLIPSNIYRIAESGILNEADATLAFESGADAILVGESLVKSGAPQVAITEFLDIGRRV